MNAAVQQNLAGISEKLDAPQKPPHGAPCNGCGLCCIARLCPLGNRIFETWEGPCPALQKHSSGYGCGLVEVPEQFAPPRARSQGRVRLGKAALFLIGSGTGCDAQYAGEPANEEFRERIARIPIEQARESARAKQAWGVS